jgi:predicted dehydrogenase
MSKYTIGIIGLGEMTQAHIRWMAAEGEFEVVAVSDVNEMALEKVGEQLGIPQNKRYLDFAELIQDPSVAAIVSITPNNVHASVIRECLMAGKPLLSEKPFTRTMEEAAELLELYLKRPVPAMIGFSYRYTPAFRYARELIRQGKLGPLSSFSVQYLQGWCVSKNDIPYLWRFNKEITGTGTLGDLGAHMIDLARFLIGEFQELSAQLQTFIPERRDPVTGAMVKVEVDDFASFQSRMQEGIMGVFQTTRNAFGSSNQHEVSVYGDNGTLHASTLDPDNLIWIHEGESGQLVRSTIEVPNSYKVTQYSDFLAMLKGNVPDGLPGFMDGVRNQQVLDAIVKSNEMKKVIPLLYSESGCL